VTWKTGRNDRNNDGIPWNFMEFPQFLAIPNGKHDVQNHGARGSKFADNPNFGRREPA